MLVDGNNDCCCCCCCAADEVDRAVAVALDDILLPQIAQKGKGCKRALMCLGQLSKALVMRGHARFQVMHTFSCTPHLLVSYNAFAPVTLG